MNFIEAVESLKLPMFGRIESYHVIKRKIWQEALEKDYLSSNDHCMFIVDDNTLETNYNYTPTKEDILATDWFVEEIESGGFMYVDYDEPTTEESS